MNNLRVKSFNFKYGVGLRLVPLVIGAVLALTACAPKLPADEPLLPEGFLTTPILKVQAAAYGYFRTATPFVFDWLQLSPGKAVSAFSVWIEKKDAYAVKTAFPTTEEARLAQDALKGREDLWLQQEEDKLFLVSPRGDKGASLTEAINKGDQGDFRTQYPEIWATMRWLPSKPISPPIGVGFISLNDDMVSLVKDRGIPAITEFAPALGSLGIDHMVMAVYSDGTPAIPQDLAKEKWKDWGAATLVVAKPTIPNFLVVQLLTSVANAGNLTRVDINGTQTFYLSKEDLHAYFWYNGAVIYMAISPSQEKARLALQSALLRAGP